MNYDVLTVVLLYVKNDSHMIYVNKMYNKACLYNRKTLLDHVPEDFELNKWFANAVLNNIPKKLLNNLVKHYTTSSFLTSQININKNIIYFYNYIKNKLNTVSYLGGKADMKQYLESPFLIADYSN
jgi:hypothetical protein